MKTKTRFWQIALLCAFLFPAVDAQLAVCEELPSQILGFAAQISLLKEASDILGRARMARLASDDLARSRELVEQFERLLASRQHYIKEIDALRYATEVLPNERTRVLARERDSIREYVDSLPPRFSGRDAIRSLMQQLNLATKLDERGTDRHGTKQAVLSNLFYEAELYTRVVFSYVALAKAGLQQHIGHVDVARSAKEIRAKLNSDLEILWEFSSAILEDPHWKRRSIIDNGKLVDELQIYGEYQLKPGEQFDRELHCPLADMDASMALRGLAKRFGVDVGDVPTNAESCFIEGDTVGIWLVAPQAKLVRFPSP